MQPSFQDHLIHVEQLVEAALGAVEPASAVQQHLRLKGQRLTVGADTIIHTHLPADGDVYLISVGKAAVPMGLAATQVLGDYLTGGIIIAKSGERNWRTETAGTIFDQDDPAFQLYEAGHPVSDENSLLATRAVAQMLAHTKAHDLVLCLISGGASALLSQPLLSLPDWQQLTDFLLKSGCTINELNCVRRQLDEVKGGGLARWGAPATCVSLILSDVVGNPLDVIGSGPTVHSQETLADAATILARYQVATKLDTAVWPRIVQALHRLRQLPPPPEVRTHALIVGDVRQAATAALVRAAQLGFTPQLLTAQMEGEARELGRFAAAIAKDSLPGSCVILGGESTVTVRGAGVGGRNQEAALSAAIALDGQQGRVIACFASDGEDGPTSAAGAIVSGNTVQLGREQRLDAASYLARNDSNTYFRHLDTPNPDSNAAAAPSLLQTGPTGTNVNDLLFILAYPNNPVAIPVTQNTTVPVVAYNQGNQNDH